MLNIEVAGDKACEIILHFPQPLHKKDILSDTEGVRAFLAGPLVLAAEGITKTKTPELEEFVRGKDGKLIAGTNVFKPYKEFVENEEYRMYFEVGKEEM